MTMSAPLDDLVETRRFLHAEPELSMEEYDTAAYVTRRLEALGLDEIRTGVGKTGVLGTLRGGRPGKTTLLRADMDGLPILEAGVAGYRSQRPGVMHACGHDGHMAILLAAAATLAARREEIPGTLVFCFQPGEEGSAGNRLMIEDGALEHPRVDRTFALHLYTGLDVGYIGVRDGAFFASADEFTLTVRGKGGHGAMPERAFDPVLAGAHVVTLLQSIVSREIAAKDPAVITVGAFTAGTTFNVIPTEATLKGTVRCFDAEIRASMPVRIRRIVEGLAAALRVECVLDYHWSYPPTVNDGDVNDVVRAVGRAVLGPDRVVEHDIVMWAEDMSFMQERVPGAYFIVGARGGEATAHPHHSANFDIDERSLEVGWKMMTELALTP